MRKKDVRWPAKLVLARFYAAQLSDIIFNRYLRCFARARAKSIQKGYDKIFQKFYGSNAWREICCYVFSEYLGQYSFTTPEQIRFLIDALKITSQSRVIDLACGVGGLSCYLAKASGCKIVGLDLSPVAVKIAKENAMFYGLVGRASFKVGILPEIPFQSEYFDVVISIDSVYGVPDKSRLLRECYRILRRGGRIGFYTLYKRRSFSPITALHARALYWFPLKPYTFLLERAGFRKISKIDMTGEFVEIARRWVKAMHNKRQLLEEELGKDTTDGLLNGDIPIALKLAEMGFIGRAFFMGEKP